MLQKFYDNTIQSNYIKYILQNNYIPTVPFVKNINHVTKNQIYIHDNYFVRAKVSEETSEIFYRLNQNPADYANYFERFDPYIFGKQYYGLTTNYVSNTGTYDSETHYYLGQYLRAYKAYYDIDLMPFYNCFSDEYISNISLKVNSQKVAPYITLENETNSNYKIISVPISFCKEYTIALESDSEIVCVPVLLGKKGVLTNLTNKLWGTLNVANHPNLHLKSNYIFNSTSFTKPIYFHSPCIPGTDDTEQLSLIAYEKYLRLLIRIPITNNSTITILEGHYSNVQSTCDRIINLDSDQIEELLNTSNIELTIKNQNDHTRNINLSGTFDNVSDNINKINCRGLQNSIKTCSTILPPVIKVDDNGVNYASYSINPLKIDTVPLQLDNIRRKEQTVIKSCLRSYTNLNNDPTTYSIDLLDIFGRGKVFVVGNTNQFKIQDNQMSKRLSELHNTQININEYSKLIYSLNNVNESISNKIIDYTNEGIEIETDTFLSNGSICLGYLKGYVLEGLYQVQVHDHDGLYKATFKLTFTPDVINKLSGTLEVETIGSYKSIEGIYSYNINPSSADIELYKDNNLITNWRIQLGYKPESKVDESNTDLISVDEVRWLTLDKDPNYVYTDQIYLGVIPESHFYTPTSQFLGTIPYNGALEIFLQTHVDDLSDLDIKLLKSPTPESLNDKFIGNNNNYLEFGWSEPKQTTITTFKHLPLQYWNMLQVIRSNTAFTDYLNKYLITNLSLLKINDHNSYAFTSRLYEYLTGHIIDSDEQFEQNIKNIQKKLQLSDSGFWTDDLRINIYYVVQTYLNNYVLPNIDDLNGFVDKDSEKILKAITLKNYTLSLRVSLEPYINLSAQTQQLTMTQLNELIRIFNKWKSQVYYIKAFREIIDCIIDFQKEFSTSLNSDGTSLVNPDDTSKLIQQLNRIYNKTN